MEQERKRNRNFTPVAAAAKKLINPLLQKKAGLNIRLIENWAEIAGADIADAAVPLKIIWPRQSGAELRAGGLRAGMLVIGCFGCAALQAQHKTGEIIARINRFFGYMAIDRIRIEQKTAPAFRRSGRDLSEAGSGLLGAFGDDFRVEAREESAVSAVLQQQAEGIKDENLRAALLRLGANLHK